MKLSPHFSTEEFEETQHREIENKIPPELMDDAKETAYMMERIRAYLSDRAKKDVRIDVTSGYRCLALNTAIGSKPTSDHVQMLAVDFKAPDFGTPLEVCQALVPAFTALELGQLIYERTWVHVSRRAPEKYINRMITARAPQEFIPGIVEV